MINALVLLFIITLVVILRSTDEERKSCHRRVCGCTNTDSYEGCANNTYPENPNCQLDPFFCESFDCDGMWCLEPFVEGYVPSFNETKCFQPECGCKISPINSNKGCDTWNAVVLHGESYCQQDQSLCELVCDGMWCDDTDEESKINKNYPTLGPAPSKEETIVKTYYTLGVGEGKTNNFGFVQVVPNVTYKVSFEILANDLGDDNEYVENIIINDIEWGYCIPEGNDYDCHFVPCHNQITMASRGSMVLNTKLTQQSHDCDCNLDTFECKREFAERESYPYPVTAMVRMTFVPEIWVNGYLREGEELKYSNVIFICPENSYLKIIEYYCSILENYYSIFIRAFECSDGTRSNLIDYSRWDEYNEDTYYALKIEQETKFLNFIYGDTLNGFVFGGVCTDCPGVDLSSLIASGNMTSSNHFCNNHTVISGMRIRKKEHIDQVDFFCRAFESSPNELDEKEVKHGFLVVYIVVTLGTLIILFFMYKYFKKILVQKEIRADNYRLIEDLLAHESPSVDKRFIDDRGKGHRIDKTMLNLFGKPTKSPPPEEFPFSLFSYTLKNDAALLPEENITYPKLSKTQTSSVREYNIETDDLELESIIGTGNFGKVYKGKWLGCSVAVKISKTKKISSDWCREIGQITKIEVSNHPCICKYYGSCLLEDGRIGLVSDFYDEGDLQNYLWNHKSFSLLMKANMIFQICSGLSYLHSHRVIHGDLACRNCLVKENKNQLKIALTDFGFSTMEDDEIDRNNKFFPITWCSPELLESRRRTIKSDIWAAGITFWEIFHNGQKPFQKQSQVQIYSNLIDRKINLKFESNLPSYAIVMMCLDYDPEERPSAKLLLNEFKKYSSQIDQSVLKEKKLKFPSLLDNKTI